MYVHQGAIKICERGLLGVVDASRDVMVDVVSFAVLIMVGDLQRNGPRRMCIADQP